MSSKLGGDLLEAAYSPLAGWVQGFGVLGLVRV